MTDKAPLYGGALFFQRGKFMKQGQFYFISDIFYENHDPENKLMKNKEGLHDRPCFYAFPDKQASSIYWCVPISSQITKYKSIVDHKIETQRQKGIKNPKCNTICFGEVMGYEKAFLIQNMFPVTDKYITSVYIDRNTNNPVTIDPLIEKNILASAHDILKLVLHGHTRLVFSNIIETRTELLAELQAEKTEICREAPRRDMELDDDLDLDL
jgi:hypothetical protein